MPKINRHRKIWKIRIPIPKPDRIIDPETVYKRDKEKEKWQKELKKYLK